MEEVAREVGVSKHTSYACKQEYGGMEVGHPGETEGTRRTFRGAGFDAIEDEEEGPTRF